MDIRDAIGDWIMDNMGTIIIVALVVVGIGFYYAVKDTGRQHSAFMTECRQYQKNYECTALWRAGEQRGVTYIAPVVIPRR